MRTTLQGVGLFLGVLSVAAVGGALVDWYLGLVVLGIGVLGMPLVGVALGTLLLDWPGDLRVELKSDRLEIGQFWCEDVYLEEIDQVTTAFWPSPAVVLHLEDGWWVRIPLGDLSRPADFDAVRGPILRARDTYRGFLEGRHRILPKPVLVLPSIMDGDAEPAEVVAD